MVGCKIASGRNYLVLNKARMISSKTSMTIAFTTMVGVLPQMKA